MELPEFPEMLPVYARDEELEEVQRLFAAVDDGPPSALVLEGPAGIGKTTVWLEAVAGAEDRGFHVLQARPTEAEAAFGFSALADLVRMSFEDMGGRLPGPQFRALASALLLDDASPERFGHAAAAGFLGIVGFLTESAPVVVAVDDAQWLDRPTRRVLEYAIPRLPRGVGVIVAVRGDGRDDLPLGLERGFPHERRRRLVLAPLSFAAIHHLIRERTGRVPPRPVLVQLVAASGGNAYVALEIARVLAQESLPRRLDEPLPVPRTAQELAAARVEGLSAGAANAVLLVAALGQATRETLLRALGSSEDGTGALEEAETAGVLVTEGQRVRFSHPLLASAVYAGASPLSRRRAHELLSRLASDVEERARHLARAVVVPDSADAAVIEEGAGRAVARQALDVGAALFEAAAAATPPGEDVDRARRLVGAGRALEEIGDLASARRFADEAARAAPHGPGAGEAQLLLASLDWYAGAAAEAAERVDRALAATVDDDALQARVLSRSVRFSFAHDFRRGLQNASAAVELLTGSGQEALLGPVLIDRFFAAALRGRPAPLATLELGLRLEEAKQGESAKGPHPIPLVWFHCVDAFAAARSRFEWEKPWYRERGDDVSVADRCSHLALAELRSGNPQRAEELLEEAAATVAGLDLTGPHAMIAEKRALLDAVRGRTDQARNALAPMVAQFEEAGQRWWAALTLSTLALTERYAGDDAAADTALRLMRRHAASVGAKDILFDRSEPYRVESLAAAGDVEGARRELRRLERRGRMLPRAWIDAALPAARALVMAAEGEIGAATSLLDGVERSQAFAPFETAWALLARGRLERRAKQKQASADTLRRAADAFEGLGAGDWARRAEIEIERAGLRRRPAGELTVNERRVAELAASGLTNREVAAAAFMSIKTVEANLARVYRKLGIRSRAELGATIATEGLSAEP